MKNLGEEKKKKVSGSGWGRPLSAAQTGGGA